MSSLRPENYVFKFLLVSQTFGQALPRRQSKTSSTVVGLVLCTFATGYVMSKCGIFVVLFWTLECPPCRVITTTYLDPENKKKEDIPSVVGRKKAQFVMNENSSNNIGGKRIGERIFLDPDFS